MIDFTPRTAALVTEPPELSRTPKLAVPVPAMLPELTTAPEPPPPMIAVLALVTVMPEAIVRVPPANTIGSRISPPDDTTTSPPPLMVMTPETIPPPSISSVPLPSTT